MEWSNDDIIEFLDLYAAEPVIWDPQHKDHKDRNKVYDAWKFIQNKISTERSLKELKKKKENLMATYRKLAVKTKNSKTTGIGSDDIFKPKWFAFEKMASFLHSVYSPRETKTTMGLEYEVDTNAIEIDSVDCSITNSDSQNEDKDESEDEENASSDIGIRREITRGGPPITKKRKTEKNIGEVEKLMDEASLFLKQPRDETSIFCELLFVKLRALDDDIREIAMYEINNLMFNLKRSKTSYYNYQPRSYISPSQNSSACTTVLHDRTSNTEEVVKNFNTN